MPASHETHNVVPATSLYVPATHGVHVPPSGPVAPGSHVQAVNTKLASSEFECAGHAAQVRLLLAPACTEYEPLAQAVHTSGPGPALYFPVAHCVQEPPSGPVEPALQVQAVASLLPSTEFERSAHARHASAWTAPMAAKYVPAPQSIQSWGPLRSLYFPAAHCTHKKPLFPV